MEFIKRIHKTKKPVTFRRGNKTLVRMMPTTDLTCFKCNKKLSGRKAPVKNDGSPMDGKSSIRFILRNGGVVAVHRSCEHYTLSPGRKGSGYCDVPRLMGRRKVRRGKTR